MSRVPVGRPLALDERAASILLRCLPIKHGKHRLLDQLYPRMRHGRTRTVRVRYRRHQLTVDAGELVGWHLAMLRSFDPEVSEVLVAIADGATNQVLWDIGANKCACSLDVATRLPACRIVCIEPQAALSRINRANLEVYCPGRFEYHEVGVGLEAATMSLYVPDYNTGHASLQTPSEAESIRVEQVSIATASQILQSSKFGSPSIVKIDVEGHEPEVVESLEFALANNSIRGVVFECHRDRQDSLDRILSVARRHGYESFAIRKSALSTSLRRVDAYRQSSLDFVVLSRACLKSSKAVRRLIRV